MPLTNILHVVEDNLVYRESNYVKKSSRRRPPSSKLNVPLMPCPPSPFDENAHTHSQDQNQNSSTSLWIRPQLSSYKRERCLAAYTYVKKTCKIRVGVRGLGLTSDVVVGVFKSSRFLGRSEMLIASPNPKFKTTWTLYDERTGNHQNSSVVSNKSETEKEYVYVAVYGICLRLDL